MRSRMLIALGVVCLIIAGVWETANLNDDYKKKENASKTLIAVEEKIYNGDISNDNKILINESEYCGILEIPSISIKLSVTSEYTNDLLKYNLCRYYGNPVDGNMVICGHNNRSFFGRLDEVNEKEEIFFTDESGNKHKYTVIDTIMLDGYNVDSMIEDSDNWQLTLFTCNYSGSARYALRCKEEN